MNNEIEKEYLSMLDKISDVDLMLKKLQRKSRRLGSKIGVILAQLIVDIGSFKDDKGKLVFSNERMREAELTLRENDNSDYMKYREEQFILDDKIDDLVVEHNKLVDIKYMLMLKLGIPFDEGAEQYPYTG